MKIRKGHRNWFHFGFTKERTEIKTSTRKSSSISSVIFCTHLGRQEVKNIQIHLATVQYFHFFANFDCSINLLFLSMLNHKSISHQLVNDWTDWSACMEKKWRSVHICCVTDTTKCYCMKFLLLICCSAIIETVVMRKFSTLLTVAATGPQETTRHKSLVPMHIFHPPPIVVIFVQHPDKFPSSHGNIIVVARLEIKQNPQHGLSFTDPQGVPRKGVAGFPKERVPRSPNGASLWIGSLRRIAGFPQ